MKGSSQEQDNDHETPDSPLPPLSDSQQLTNQRGVRREDQLHSALLQDGQGAVGPGRASESQGHVLYGDLCVRICRVVGQAASVGSGDRLGLTVAVLTELDQEPPLVQRLGLHAWKNNRNGTSTRQSAHFHPVVSSDILCLL